jgi:hypothetical protein
LSVGSWNTPTRMEETEAMGHYDVVIKGILKAPDEMGEGVDTDVIVDALGEEFDNTDIDISIESDDDDMEEVGFAFVVADIEVTEAKEA